MTYTVGFTILATVLTLLWVYKTFIAPSGVLTDEDLLGMSLEEAKEHPRAVWLRWLEVRDVRIYELQGKLKKGEITNQQYMQELSRLYDTYRKTKD